MKNIAAASRHLHLRARWRGKSIPTQSVLMLLGVVTLAGCGPRFGIDASIKDINENVVFGAQHSPTPVEQPPAVAGEPFPSFPVPYIAPGPGVPEALLPSPLHPVVAPAVCPSASPFAFPALEAATSANQMPSPGVYQFHYQGTYKPSSGPAVQMPTSGTREVSNPHAALTPGNFDFDVIEHYNGLVITSSYEVQPQVTDAPENLVNPIPPQPVNGGIYLVQMAMELPGGSPQVFAPRPMLQLIPFPAQAGVAFGGHGTDAANQETEDLQPAADSSAHPPPTAPPVSPSPVVQPGTQITDRTRVDACGTVLDSWQVNLFGTFTGLARFNLNDDVDFATQYGGLPIYEHRRWSGTSVKDGNFTFDWTATISQAPARTH